MHFASEKTKKRTKIVAYHVKSGTGPEQENGLENATS
jgi:hypothetical protein